MMMTTSPSADRFVAFPSAYGDTAFVDPASVMAVVPGPRKETTAAAVGTRTMIRTTAGPVLTTMTAAEVHAAIVEHEAAQAAEAGRLYP